MKNTARTILLFLSLMSTHINTSTEITISKIDDDSPSEEKEAHYLLIKKIEDKFLPNSPEALIVWRSDLDIVDSAIVIDTGVFKFIAAHDQMFYDPIKQEWIEAQDLNESNALLLKYRYYLDVLSVKKVYGQFEIARIFGGTEYSLHAQELLTYGFNGILLDVKRMD